MPKNEIKIIQPPNIHYYLMAQMVGYRVREKHLALALVFFFFAIILIVIAAII